MKQHRVGSMFLEVCVASVVAAATLAMIAQLLTLASRQQRINALQRQAACVAGNVMERIMARPWEELAPDKLQPLVSSEELASLPEADVQIEVLAGQQPESREIRVSVTWTSPRGQPRPPVQLVAWRFRQEETAPP